MRGTAALQGEPPVAFRARAHAAHVTTAMVALVRMREDPFRTVGKEGQAFSVSPAFAPALPKKPAPSLL
jgi:hypothetical protein